MIGLSGSTLRRAAAAALERGAFGSPLSLFLASAWARHARVERPLALPDGAHVVGVGGATLGGSHRTPLTLALALALGNRGAPVAVVAHGYGAAVRLARRVLPEDTAESVGDDALWLARDLSDRGVPVFVGPRCEAVLMAAASAPLVLVDGLLQTSPRRLSLSVLAVDARAPWGAGRCPPAGDLRAPREALLVAADLVAAVGTNHEGRDPGVVAMQSSGRPVLLVESELTVAKVGNGVPASLDELAGARVGLVLAIARPDRVFESLRRRGIHPVETRLFADHAVPAPLARGARPVDLWLTTPKCATKIGASYAGAPVHVLRQRLIVPDALVSAVLGARDLPESREVGPRLPATA